MRQLFSILTVCLTFTLVAQNATAQAFGPNTASAYYFEETFFPVYVSKNDAANPAGGSDVKNVPTETGLGFDFRTTLGYVFWGQMLLGLTYNYYQVNTSRPETADYEGLNTTYSRKELGPTIGYFLNSWRFALTYFITAEKTFSQKYQANGATTTDEIFKNAGGSGFQVAIGYDLNLGGGFELGPTLVYRTVSYTKQVYTVNSGVGNAYDSATLATKPLDVELKPMITLIYRY